MSFKLGNTSISELYVGSTKIGSAYLGSTKVYELSSPFPYQTVTIGNQVWMAETLKLDDGGEGIYTIDNCTINGVNYGTVYYYTCAAATRVAELVTGWHLPTKSEVDTLVQYVNNGSYNSTLCTKMKSTTGWSNNGTDDYGWNAKPLGMIDHNSQSLGNESTMWQANNYRWYMTNYNSTSNGTESDSYKYPIRLIKNTTPVWPPTGTYALCARLYTDSNLNHITVNTVSWNYDSGSSTTYSDSNCTQALSDLSSWNDYSANTVLSTIGQSQYGTYVDIFTNDSSMTPTNFCLILANDRVQTVTDNSWRVTRVEVYKPGSGTIYKNNNSPSKGQWFRGKSGWSTL